ncbi:Single-stranded-DNA-specific exonuclease RecJ [hydrothermal vent metagenome]|uniref:Single-stranded-DNA-specific exonuclease RecJ n=1 Tax=hydrothermal vent metagenome TaxID=652676 RepID=A0A1W1BME1_9ZZZZ
MLYPKITPNQIEQKLKARFTKDGFLSLANLPHPSTFKDMDRATARIVQAIQQQEKIVLIGDYDVDGVVSTSLMRLFFNEIGVKLGWVIPNRFKDGYGLSANIVSQIEDYDLAITVDNGISAVEAGELCKKHNIELIITDHHLLPKKLPEAYAIIDQKQTDCSFPYDEVCGAQIAWYLIVSLKKALNVKVDTKSYIGLVAIAVIADMMPLLHINRAMVVAGLQLLNRSELPAIRAFREKLNKTVLNAEDIGFQIAPILNSAGRMDDAKWSVEFLLSQNIYDARIRLDRLVEFNDSRKETEQRITEEAIEQVNPTDKVIVVAGENWHEGVVGIVAARVGRVYEKPTIVLTKSENGDLKGSGRSFHECNLFKITNGCRELLNRFGGHHAAIGLSLPIDNLEQFRKKLQKNYLAENYSEDVMDSDILGELSFSHIDFKLVNSMKQFEPFGQANSRPKFITSNVIIEDVTNMGKNSEHRRFSFSHNRVIQQGVLFKTKKLFEIGQIVTIIYEVNENHFNGRTTLQLMLEKIIININ